MDPVAPTRCAIVLQRGRFLRGRSPIRDRGKTLAAARRLLPRERSCSQRELDRLRVQGRCGVFVLRVSRSLIVARPLQKATALYQTAPTRCGVPEPKFVAWCTSRGTHRRCGRAGWPPTCAVRRLDAPEIERSDSSTRVRYARSVMLRISHGDACRAGGRRNWVLLAARIVRVGTKRDFRRRSREADGRHARSAESRSGCIAESRSGV